MRSYECTECGKFFKTLYPHADCQESIHHIQVCSEKCYKIWLNTLSHNYVTGNSILAKSDDQGFY